jgi:predicted TIM-barrel fold metal-dependent hydrolase
VLSERYLRWTAEVVGTGHILCATDYPFVDTGAGRARAFLEQAPLTGEEKTAIGSGNWERLTGLATPPS